MYTALTVIAKYITDIVRCSCDSNLTEMNSLVYEYFVKRFLGSLVTNSTISYNSHKVYCKQIHTHPFNGPFSGTTQVGWYQKGKTNLDFTEARDSEWHCHQLGHMQVCTLLQTDNHTSTPPLCFYRPDALPAAQPTVSKH